MATKSQRLAGLRVHDICPSRTGERDQRLLPAAPGEVGSAARDLHRVEELPQLTDGALELLPSALWGEPQQVRVRRRRDAMHFDGRHQRPWNRQFINWMKRQASIG